MAGSTKRVLRAGHARQAVQSGIPRQTYQGIKPIRNRATQLIELCGFLVIGRSRFTLACMSRAWKFHNPEGLYFITFATVGWIDVFTRPAYKEIVTDSLSYCIKEKGLELFAWVLMSNHVHLVARAKEGQLLQDIVRDLKKFTSRKLLKAIEENDQESRKEWMLAIFKKAGSYNSNNTNYQLWRQDNKPIELQTGVAMQKAVDYIHANPVKEGIVSSPEHYQYSSAHASHALQKQMCSV